MKRVFRPVVSIHDNDFRAVEYFEFEQPIKQIRSMCHYLTGGAASAIFKIDKCLNSYELIRAIQSLAQKQEKLGVFGINKPHEVYIQEVQVNLKSATVILG